MTQTHHDHSHHAHAKDGSCCSGHGAKLAGAAVVRDPVCGMEVNPVAGKSTFEHGGRLFHFCSEGCRGKFEAHPELFLTAKDPVCGMDVDRASAKHFLRHEGEKYYFCSESCQKKFEADPKAYLGDRPAPAPLPKGTQYTCPMHPEIIRDKPEIGRAHV